MKQMTKAEEQVMQILWELNESNVRSIVDKFDLPKPAYTTVATVLKVLDKKGFVTKIPQGKTHLFTPKITKEEYSGHQMGSLLQDYFSGSFSKMASFFAKENNLSISDLEQMIEITKKEINKDK